MIYSGIALALSLFAASAYIFFTASRSIDAELGRTVIDANLDPGFAVGPISLTFEPIPDVPEMIRRDEAFPVGINMNLVDAGFVNHPNDALDLSEVETFLPELGSSLELRLLLAGAVISPEGWQPVGSDLKFVWSVLISAGGTNHTGTIEKRIMVGDRVADRSVDQIPIEIKIDTAFSAWKQAWGRVTGVIGFLLTVGTFYFAWREDVRKQRAQRE